MTSWLSMNPGKTVTIYDIPKIINIALPQAVSPKNILSGFAATGIYPLNPDILSEINYYPNNVTDRPNPFCSQANSNKEVCLPYSIQPKTANKRFKESIQIPANQVDTRIKDPFISNKIFHHGPITQIVFKNSIKPSESIRPLPKAGQRLTSKRGRKKRLTIILTSSPVKSWLANDKNKQTYKTKTNKNHNLL